MILRTSPMVEDGAPCVVLEIGDTEAQLTATQAEAIAESLGRAATAARYEAAIMVALEESNMLGILGTFGKIQFIETVRNCIERKRVSQN